MATATVVQFMKKTAEDKLLREQLESLLGVGDGDISSETALDVDESTALKGEQGPVVTQFAAKYGYEFSVDDLVTVVDAIEKHTEGQLSDQEFTTLVGTSVPVALNPMQRTLRFLSKTYLGY